jgi:hypothetical protein
MDLSCIRRGQGEIGIVTHDGHTYAAFGSSVSGHNVTGYTRQRNGLFSLTRWDGITMLACRCEVVHEYRDGSLTIMFRLTNRRFIVGYALGYDGMLFRGELVTDCDDDRSRHEALAIAEYWMEIDSEDEADPWHGEPDERSYPDW